MKLAFALLLLVSLASALSIREKSLLEELLEKISKADDLEEKTLEKESKTQTLKEKENQLIREAKLEQKRKESERELLQAKSVVQMSYMVRYCENNGNMGYVDYGCFCGTGGTGNVAVDAVDECCRIHDNCYGDVQAKGCSLIWAPHIIHYTYDCTYYEPNTITCIDDPEEYPCYRDSCECDKAMAYCFTKTLGSYNYDNVGYDQSKCPTV